MTGKDAVLDVIRKAVQPISGHRIRELVPAIPANSVGAYLSMLTQERQIFAMRDPNSRQGRLFYDVPFEVDYLSRVVSHPPKAAKPNGSAPMVKSTADDYELKQRPGESHSEMCARVAQAFREKKARESGQAPLTADDVKDLPDTVVSQLSKPAQKIAAAAKPPQRTPPQLVPRETPVITAIPPERTREYAFPLPRGPVVFHLPADLTADEVIGIAMMLDTYGQLKRRTAT